MKNTIIDENEDKRTDAKKPSFKKNKSRRMNKLELFINPIIIR